MVNGVGWDLLYNGSMIRAAYEVYDGASAFNGFAFGILYLLFHVMLYYKTRKAAPGLVMGLFFLSMYYANQFYSFLTIHESIIWVAGIIFVFHIAILLYEIIIKH